MKMKRVNISQACTGEGSGFTGYLFVCAVLDVRPGGPRQLLPTYATCYLISLIAGPCQARPVPASVPARSQQHKLIFARPRQSQTLTKQPSLCLARYRYRTIYRHMYVAIGQAKSTKLSRTHTYLDNAKLRQAYIGSGNSSRRSKPSLPTAKA